MRGTLPLLTIHPFSILLGQVGEWSTPTGQHSPAVDHSSILDSPWSSWRMVNSGRVPHDGVTRGEPSRAAGDRWGPLGTVGDRWGPLGTAGDRWGRCGPLIRAH